ncbi:MAG: TRAP transporter small permease [Deltaproteobacteria bacterium]|nr:TRAP transporter small permease [Deltaproteobacteria bacterium]MBW2047089.1 TRAP transporter small permease [Deltaproteobacteria bacterium]MBW2110238.1 TRAP transporter small permease [Deltaproteobacteria bacterium]MBW2351630.1 TRAP transporter small permease [Deltaproteobacteria bacterium]
MNSFWKIIDWILDMLKIIGAVCLGGMTFLTCADVVGRFFRHPIFGSVEIVGFMATLSVAMALPYTQQIKGHIGVEILVRVFSEKTQTIIDICTSFLSLGLFLIITWRMAIYAHEMHQSGEVSMNLEFPEYSIIYVTSFCFVIFSLIILRDIIQNIRKLRKR